MSKAEGDPLLKVDRLDKMGPVDPITVVSIIALKVGRGLKDRLSRKHPNPSPTFPQDK